MKMPAAKTKTRTKATEDRLVDVISNLEVTITDLQYRVTECYEIIKTQQIELTTQREITGEILKLLKHNSPNVCTENHPNTYSKIVKIPARFAVTNNVPLDESGPSGLVHIDTVYNDPNTQSTPHSTPSLTTTPPMAEQQQPIQQPVDKPRRGRPARQRKTALAQDASPSDTATATAVHQQTESVRPSVPLEPVQLFVHSEQPLVSEKQRGLRAAAPQPVSLHVFNLSVETTAEDVLRHLESGLSIKVTRCEKLTVTRGQYSSFRIDVPSDKVRLVRNSKHWPDGVAVRMFNFVQTKNLKPRGDKHLPL